MVVFGAASGSTDGGADPSHLTQPGDGADAGRPAAAAYHERGFDLQKFAFVLHVVLYVLSSEDKGFPLGSGFSSCVRHIRSSSEDGLGPDSQAEGTMPRLDRSLREI